MATGKRFRDVKSENGKTSNQFIALGKWLELYGRVLGTLTLCLYLIVKEQFINTCSVELVMFLLETVAKDLVQLTNMGLAVLHCTQATARSQKPRCFKQRKATRSKPDMMQG